MSQIIGFKNILICLITFYTFIFLSGIHPAGTNVILQQNKEDRAINKVLSLSEVKQKNRLIDSLSNHVRGVSILVTERPKNRNNGFYVMQVGNNNAIRFDVIYTFYVYLPDLTIKYYEPLSDKIISLPEWRKSK